MLFRSCGPLRPLALAAALGAGPAAAQAGCAEGATQIPQDTGRKIVGQDAATAAESGADVATGPCGGSQIKCSGKCVYPESDSANCGGCGVKCAAGEQCHAGACGLACTGGTMTCGTKCVDPKNDPANCGGCAKACAPGEVCSGGSCALQCAGGTTKCGGKCVDTNTDPANCGACDKPCAGGEVCSAGTCALQCTSPTVKCGNKCVDTNTDPANCSACAKACPAVANGAASCTGGVCGIASCNPPFKDCDGDGSDGCEANTSTDPKNCGTCGNDCPAPANGLPACKTSTCGLGACIGGFADCDGNAANGCETTTSTDTKNCGACGKVCSSNNVTPSCAAGACAGTCAAGFADCNNNKQTDGCEANLASDTKNCGACGTACTGTLCGTSVSAPMTSQPTGWSFNGTAAFDAVASSGVLTTLVAGAGSIVYSSPIVTNTFTATFDFKIGGGTGGDGMGFMIQTDGPTAIGGGGGGLGIGDLQGYGVELDTFDNAQCGESTANHVAVSQLKGCPWGQPQMLQTSTSLPFALRDTGWHACSVLFENGKVTVSLDGAAVMAPYTITTFAAGTKYYYGFGAATGGSTDRHEVRNVKITFPTARCL
jgi:hypothetical protein